MSPKAASFLPIRVVPKKTLKKPSFYSRIYSFFNDISKKTSMRIIELNF